MISFLSDTEVNNDQVIFIQCRAPLKEDTPENRVAGKEWMVDHHKLAAKVLKLQDYLSVSNARYLIKQHEGVTYIGYTQAWWRPERNIGPTAEEL